MGNWRKSTYSDASGGNCLETASGGGQVLVRDTADRRGRALAFSAGAWHAFVTGLRHAVPGPVPGHANSRSRSPHGRT
jgi:hypothetical protein